MPAWTQVAGSDRVAPFRAFGILGSEFDGLAQRNAEHLARQADEPGRVSLALLHGERVVGALQGRPNEWESRQFRRRVLRTDGPAFVPGTDREQGAYELARALLTGDGSSTLLIASVDSGDLPSVVGFQRAGLVVHDSVLTLALRVSGGEASDGGRAASPTDGVRAFDAEELRSGRAASAEEVDHLAALGPRMFSSSHFHSDRRLRPEDAEAVYDHWTRAAFSGEWADWMLVARDVDGAIASFVAFAEDSRFGGDPCVLGSSFGFSVPPHGRGFTSRLSARLGEAPAHLVTTVVQARNLAQVNGLQRAGMQVVRSALVLHGWSP
jgi:hypothetical protein